MALKIEYPLHKHWIELFNKFSVIYDALKEKSTPLIIDDVYAPPINYERTDLPWSLGSKSFPWKNLYISNTKASESSRDRHEVLDVYTELTNIPITYARKDIVDAHIQDVHENYATKKYVDEKINVGSYQEAKVKFMEEDWEYDEELDKYVLELEKRSQEDAATFLGLYKLMPIEDEETEEELGMTEEMINANVMVITEYERKEVKVLIVTQSPIELGYVNFLCRDKECIYILSHKDPGPEPEEDTSEEVQEE